MRQVRRRQIQPVLLVRVQVGELERADEGKGEGQKIFAWLVRVEETAGGDGVESED